MSETMIVDGVEIDKDTGEVINPEATAEENIAAEMTPEGAPEDDETDETDEKPEPEPDPQPVGMSEKEMEKRFKSLETRATTWRKYVTDFSLETDQPLVPCPLCLPASPGFIFHPQAIPLNEDQENAMRVLLGEPIMPDYRPIPSARTCPACNGEGRVLTGSKVTNKKTIECPECKGSGWVGEAKNLTPAQAARPELVQVSEEGVPPEDLPKTDPWGTPEWDPDYYKMPPGRTPGWDNGTGVWVHPDQRTAV